MVRVDPHTDKVLNRVKLPGDLAQGSGTFAAGSMWIAGSTGVDRVDPDSGSILAEIPVTGGGAGIAGSDTNGIWMTSHAPDENVVWEIDPTTNTVARRVRLPGHPYAGPWIGDKVVWLASTNTIWKLDPASGTILARIPYNIPTRATDNIASAGDGALWLADPEGLVPGEGLRFGVVVRIDERTNALSRVAVARVDGIAVGGGAVWARSGVAGELTGTGDVTEINPDTNHVIQTIKLGHADWVVAGQDAIWVENQTDKTVVRLNPATGEPVSTLHLPPTERAIGEAGNALWVGVWP
jgi:streptogramin lyase